MRLLAFFLILTSFAFFTPVPVYAAAPTDYVSCWNLNETSGTRVDSNTTNSNDLTDNNTVLYGTGKVSNAADFEKSTNEYLSITDASQVGLDITGDISIGAWVNFESKTNQQVQSIATKYNSVAGQRSFIFALWDSEVPSVGTWNLLFWPFNSSEQSDMLNAAWNPSLATWYYVTVTWDASAATAEFFVNGSSIGSETGVRTDIQNSTGPFQLGAFGGANYLFDGMQDIVEVYNRLLTGTEITALYNNGNGVACDDRTSAAPETPVYGDVIYY